MTETREYAPGRLLDVHGDPSAATVLLWHGRGPDEREVLAPFAGLIADTGLRVVVPDWDSTSEDGGRTHLLLSIKHVLGLDTPWLVAGWSLGGAAAASLALNGRKLGLGPIAGVSLAGVFTKEDPLTGRPFLERVIYERRQGTITLIHGVDDAIAAVEASQAFHRNLTEAGWSGDLFELDTDHAGIVGVGAPGREAAAIVAREAHKLIR